MEQDRNTEEKVLLAAKKVFVLKGMTGARMQEIADEAGINKSLLHYYFRSKEKLFEAVFSDTFSRFIPKIDVLLSSGKSLEDKIKDFVKAYIELLQQNPHLPQFILQEINRNPDRLVELMNLVGVSKVDLVGHLNRMLKEANIKNVNAKHLFVNLIALCIFPFVARPMLEHVILDNKQDSFEKLIEERKTEIPKFIINSIINS